MAYHVPRNLQQTFDPYKPHQCSFCGRCFKRKDHKVEHERIHTGERPYPCTACPKAFIQKQQLVNHQRRRHGILPLRTKSSRTYEDFLTHSGASDQELERGISSASVRLETNPDIWIGGDATPRFDDRPVSDGDQRDEGSRSLAHLSALAEWPNTTPYS